MVNTTQKRPKTHDPKQMASRFDGGYCSACHRNHIKRLDRIEPYDTGWASHACVQILIDGGTFQNATRPKKHKKESIEIMRASWKHTLEIIRVRNYGLDEEEEVSALADLDIEEALSVTYVGAQAAPQSGGDFLSRSV